MNDLFGNAICLLFVSVTGRTDSQVGSLRHIFTDKSSNVDFGKIDMLKIN